LKKPPSLRAALTAALDPKHHISKNPDRLLMVATNAVTLASGRPGSGFEYRYTLELTFLDFAGDPAEITIPLLLWIQRYQHQMLASPDATTAGMNMTFELLDAGKYDAHVALQLTEAVRYAPRDGGGYDVVFIDTPVPMAFEDGEPLHAVFLDGEQILHCAAHPDLGV
tara:strand:- start:2457 stop:2960 length:504 start_codon:yes stop_codon:yes gene_type:complete